MNVNYLVIPSDLDLTQEYMNAIEPIFDRAHNDRWGVKAVVVDDGHWQRIYDFFKPEQRFSPCNDGTRIPGTIFFRGIVFQKESEWL
jgi:hypothetical protein